MIVNGAPKVFSSVQLSRVQLFATPWIAVRQASLSITNSRSLLKLISMELVMPFSHLILCRPLLLLPPIPLSIRVFSNESALRMRWPKYWSFSFSISPSNEHPGKSRGTDKEIYVVVKSIFNLKRKLRFWIFWHPVEVRQAVTKNFMVYLCDVCEFC